MYIFDISILGIQIAPTWYWLMYALGFSFCYLFGARYGKVQKQDLDNILLYIFLGVILGWRIGYVILYNPMFFISNPLEIFSIWKWGMSFHGGFLWVLIAVLLFARKYSYRFFDITDTLAVCVPVALGLGRIGNWINGELPWYAGYTWLLAMKIGDISYFPSPVLQAFLEGIVLTSIMMIIWKTWVSRRAWFLSGCFLVWYALVRLIAENYRLPDEHIGYLFSTSWITLGMIYTLPLMLAGIIILMWTTGRKQANE
jgi:phosphatidylglycerol:prolipoprotein diacylglycerol transferase